MLLNVKWRLGREGGDSFYLCGVEAQNLNQSTWVCVAMHTEVQLNNSSLFCHTTSSLLRLTTLFIQFQLTSNS